MSFVKNIVYWKRQGKMKGMDWYWVPRPVIWRCEMELIDLKAIPLPGHSNGSLQPPKKITAGTAMEKSVISGFILHLHKYRLGRMRYTVKTVFGNK